MVTLSQTCRKPLIGKENIQAIFLREVKKRVPSHISLADDLSEILHMSRDSAYRRLRGETILSLDEVKQICNYYSVSLDALLSSESDTVTFRYQGADNRNFGFENWMKSILSNLEMISAAPEKELFYSAKDVPVFYLFDSPELAAFKIYFWNKTILETDHFQNKKFDPNLVSNELLGLAKRIWEKYSQVPTTEFWSEETINVTLRQIEYTYECGFFKKPEDVINIIDQFSILMNNINQWATKGLKNGGGKLSLYKNDILIADNTIFFKMGNRRIAFLPHSLEYIATSQENFCNHTEHYFKNLLKKSSLISSAGEKQRNIFFNGLEEKILALKNRIL